ncbi:MAG: TetR/AcrR family transcriptional regulator [Marmoricola sp.]
MPRKSKDSPVTSGPVDASPDGRAARWESHRENRRAELVDAAVAAIDQYGPDASIAEIAAVAGVSRPVLYRYFADKDDLHRAVGLWGATTVLDGLLPALLSDQPVRERVRAGVDAYLTLIDQHPHVFTLLVGNAGNGDPLADGKEMIAAAIARTMGDVLREVGVDAGGAEPWAHGLVGLGLSTGTWWLDRRTMTKAAVGTYLTGFVWHAFEGITAECGVELDAKGRLRVVDQ